MVQDYGAEDTDLILPTSSPLHILGLFNVPTASDLAMEVVSGIPYLYFLVHMCGICTLFCVWKAFIL